MLCKGEAMDEKNETEAFERSDVESTTRDDKCKDESKDFESMIPA